MSEVRAGSSEVRVGATDELRRMLDERGVKWDGTDSPYGLPQAANTTTWGTARFREWPSGTTAFNATNLTPEQAIDATLGWGTCRLEREPNSDRLWWCSSCQSYHEHVSEFPWEYCPRCGAKAVE